MRKIIAIMMAAAMMTMTIGCASSGQPAGGTSEGKEAAAAQETVQDQAAAAASVQEAATAATAPEAATAATAAAAQEAATAATALAAETAATAQEAATAAAAQEAAAPEQEIPVEKIEALFGEGGPLYGMLPEGTDTKAIAEAARDQMDEVNRRFGRAIEEIVEKSENESIDFTDESLQKFAEMLLGQFVGSQADSDDEGEIDHSLDALIEAGQTIDKTEKEYIIEHNSGLMESGDVQIVASDVYHEDDIEQPEFKVLCSVIQNNYRMDEENQLWLVDSAEDFVQFTHERDQEGNYPVKDAVFAEKGDNYLSSVEAMLKESGESIDAEILEEDLETSRALALFDLKFYLEEHPEVKGIEYDGEIRTDEELDQIWTVKVDELCDKYGHNAAEEEAAYDASTGAVPAAE